MIVTLANDCPCVPHLHITDSLICQADWQSPWQIPYAPGRECDCSGIQQVSVPFLVSYPQGAKVVKNQYGFQGLTSPETLDPGCTGEKWKNCGEYLAFISPRFAQKAIEVVRQLPPHGELLSFGKLSLPLCSSVFPGNIPRFSVIPHYDSSQMTHKPAYSPTFPLACITLATSPPRFVIFIHN